MIVLYMLRRLTLAATVIFLQSFPWLQLTIMMYTSIFLLGYHLRAKPYEYKRFASFELLNEVSVLILTYVLITVSWTSDGNTRKLQGQILIGIVMITVGLNLINFLLAFVFQIYVIIKKIIFLVRLAIIKIRNCWRRRKDLPLIPEPRWPWPRRRTVAIKPLLDQEATL